MQESFSVKLQQIVQAKNAEYDLHDGILLCCICEEPVFLRKAHERKGYKVSDAFIHHEDSKFAATCKLRSVVNRELIHKAIQKRHNQTITKLQVHMWRYLKTNLCIDLKHWMHLLKDCQTKKQTFNGLCEWCEELYVKDWDGVWKCYKKLHESLRTNKFQIVSTSPEINKKLYALCRESTDVYWYRHLNVSWQAYKLFTSSPYFKDMRKRIYGVLAHPDYLASAGITADRWMADLEEVNKEFAIHLIGYTQYIFLTVDWQALL